MLELNIQTINNPPDFSGEIDINQQVDFEIDSNAIRKVVAAILCDHGFCDGAISLAIVDDPTMHRLNVTYLQHDYPTDVLSFTLASDPQRGWLEGEVIVSSDTAQTVAKEYHWAPATELLLYFIHGTLHLVGMDDATDELRQNMQHMEDKYLQLLGLRRGNRDESEAS